MSGQLSHNLRQREWQDRLLIPFHQSAGHWRQLNVTPEETGEEPSQFLEGTGAQSIFVNGLISGIKGYILQTRTKEEHCIHHQALDITVNLSGQLDHATESPRMLTSRGLAFMVPGIMCGLSDEKGKMGGDDSLMTDFSAAPVLSWGESRSVPGMQVLWNTRSSMCRTCSHFND